MKLNELVQSYDGEVLFDARETEMVRDEAQERPIVSFDRNERDAIKSEILERPVDKFRVEVTPVNNVRGKTYNVIVVALLGEVPAEENNTDPGSDPTPTPVPDEGTDSPSENV